MSDNHTAATLARLQMGFRTDSARLKELEGCLDGTLKSALEFDRNRGSQEPWNSAWQGQWDAVAANLHRTNGLVGEMDSAIEGGDSDRLCKALSAWESIQTEETRLGSALKPIRTRMSGLSAGERKDWNHLALGVEQHLESIHARAQLLRIKLELMKRHYREDVDRLVTLVCTNRPDMGGDGEEVPGANGSEYRRAAKEMSQDQHDFTGFMDVVKALSLWGETPAERLRKNRSLQVDEG